MQKCTHRSKDTYRYMFTHGSKQTRRCKNAHVTPETDMHTWLRIDPIKHVGAKPHMQEQRHAFVHRSDQTRWYKNARTRTRTRTRTGTRTRTVRRTLIRARVRASFLASGESPPTSTSGYLKNTCDCVRDACNKRLLTWIRACALTCTRVDMPKCSPAYICLYVYMHTVFT